MTQSRFSHYFRARTGLTPASFIADVRVKEAARMLVETGASLQEVGEMWGFADRSHFGKVFRRVLHMSPASYQAPSAAKRSRSRQNRALPASGQRRRRDVVLGRRRRRGRRRQAGRGDDRVLLLLPGEDPLVEHGGVRVA